MTRPPLAIVNPVAGRKRGEKLRGQATARLASLFPGIEFAGSTAPGHATELALAAVGRELVIAVGGDGTVREVSAGLAGTKTELALVPVGSGNDFCKNVGIPTDLEAACAVVRDGTPRPVDLVALSIHGPAGTREHVYANAAGFGFDARVIKESRRLKSMHGLLLYAASVFLAIRDFDCPRVRITLGGRTWEQPILLLAAANGRCYGGGMRIAPEAQPDDGQLEVCVAAGMGRVRITRYLPKLIKGTHVNLREVTMHRVPRIELEFLDPVPLQLDGDLLETGGARQFRLEVLPGALKVRTPPAAGD